MNRNAQRLAVLVAAGTLGVVSLATAQDSANRMTGDNTFATKAWQGNMAEVKLGQLAQQNAESQAVKDFGSRMVADHTKINDDLKTVATRDGITLPTELDARDQATYNRLSKLNGAAFDRAYLTDMIAAHKADIAAFRHETENGTNPDLKEFAAKAMPTLQEHLQLAEQTNTQIKGKK